jgi:hypothetical protein
MAEEQDHSDCLRMRQMGTVQSLFDPNTFVRMHHISYSHDPHDVGVVGLQLLHRYEEDEDGELCDHGSIVLGIGEALGLANRLVRTCDVAMAVNEGAEEPVSASAEDDEDEDDEALSQLHGVPFPWADDPRNWPDFTLDPEHDLN